MSGEQGTLFDGPYIHPLDMTDDQFKEWLGKIRRGIGGYDIQTLMGEGGGTPMELYAKFLDMGEPIEVTAPMKRGRALEDDALELFAELTGFTIIPAEGDDMFVRHPDNKFLVAQIDGTIEADGKVIPADMGKGLVDAKVPATFTFGDYVRDGISRGNYLQVQWQMGLTGIKWATMAVLDYEGWRTLGGGEPPFFEFDPELFAEMQKRAEAFLEDHIFPRKAPVDVVADKSDFPMAVIGNEESKVVDRTHLSKLLRFFEVRQEKKLAAHEEEKLREVIEELFDHYDTKTLALSGQGERRKIHWRPGTRKQFLQKEALAALRRHGEDPNDFFIHVPTRPFKPVGD